MRIVIDMQGAQTESRFRGIGRYTMSFTQALVRNQGEHEIILALNGLFPDTIEPIRAVFDGMLPQENIRVWKTPGPVSEAEAGNEARRRVAELVREAFLASFQADVVHLSSLFEGYIDDAVTSIGRFDRNTPVSVSMYDLIPFLNQDQYVKQNRKYAQYYLRKIEYLKKAAHLLAISEFTRQEVLAHMAIPKDRVVNVSTAIEDSFQPVAIGEETAGQLRRKFSLSRPFILYTGGADERKNLSRLIEAYSALPQALREAHQLLLAGKISGGEVGQIRQQAKSSGLKPDELCLAGYVSDNELVQLYNLCKIFVFPSWHEGFGLPALEAMACGAPVIAANTSSLPEVVGLDEALFDPFDVRAITTSIQQALENEAFRALLHANGERRVPLFSWDKTASRAIEAWEMLGTERLKPSVRRFAGERKKKLAFVTPLPPARTGIADYSTELLPALVEYYDVTVVVAQDQVTDTWADRHLQIRDVAWLEAHLNEVDRVVYQIGNSPFHWYMLLLQEKIPGTVVLHDFFLSSLMAWLECHAGVPHAWTRALYASHGYPAVQERYRNVEMAKHTYPVNFDVLKHARGVFVHSEYSRQLAQKWYGKEIGQDWQVIPLVRTKVEALGGTDIRERLGFAKNDFLICSFGFLDSTKLNHRLLDCWLNSALAKDEKCHLVFVGENHGDSYGTQLLQTIRSSGLGRRIRITGFASPELFRHYLMAADVAVQLRTMSRGETSAAVLDCMNHAVPVIVNANGSMAELDSEAVWLLPDEFSDAMLIEAMETLWRQPETRILLGERAGAIVRHRHAPAECAQCYATAIERFHRRAEVAPPALIAAIAEEQCFAGSDEYLRCLAQDIAVNQAQPKPARRLFLDVTATCRNDLKTGIERVARALLLSILQEPPLGFRVEPVYLSNSNGQWQHRYARKYTLELIGCPSEALDDDIVVPECGDILVGLDYSGDILVQAAEMGLFSGYRANGTAIFSVVFDLLPVRIPEFFVNGADNTHAKWLEYISTFDGSACISKSVSTDLFSWQREMALNFVNRRPYRIDWFHLGADVTNSAPSLGLPHNAEVLLEKFTFRPSFLMVGTIEPRKGYLQAIEAFSEIWNDGINVNLLIVGSEGWKDQPYHLRRNIPETVNRLKNHAELNVRLFWLDNISDEYLEKVYTVSTCLIAASYGEGFGLPLIEAAQHNLPIIARDIPVFREVAGENAYYFSNNDDPSALASGIKEWLDLYKQEKYPRSDTMQWLTWRESAEQLVRFCTDRHVEIS